MKHMCHYIIVAGYLLKMAMVSSEYSHTRTLQCLSTNTRQGNGRRCALNQKKDIKENCGCFVLDDVKVLDVVRRFNRSQPQVIGIHRNDAESIMGTIAVIVKFCNSSNSSVVVHCPSESSGNTVSTSVAVAVSFSSVVLSATITATIFCVLSRCRKRRKSSDVSMKGITNVGYVFNSADDTPTTESTINGTHQQNSTTKDSRQQNNVYSEILDDFPRYSRTTTGVRVGDSEDINGYNHLRELTDKVVSYDHAHEEIMTNDDITEDYGKLNNEMSKIEEYIQNGLVDRCHFNSSDSQAIGEQKTPQDGEQCKESSDNKTEQELEDTQENESV